MSIESVEFEKNEYDEDVRVTTLKSGTVIRELVAAATEPEEQRFRRLSIIAWRSRFTREERVAIEFAQLDDVTAPMQQRQIAAALRSDIRDQESAQYIDLDDPDVLTGLQNLSALGLIASTRVQEIQQPDAQPEERP